MKPLSLANTCHRPREVNEVPAGTRHSTLPWANHKWWMYLNGGQEYGPVEARQQWVEGGEFNDDNTAG